MEIETDTFSLSGIHIDSSGFGYVTGLISNEEMYS